DDSGATITYRQIGNEVGTYDLYSYADGFDATTYIYLNGENRADVYVYNPASDKFAIQKSGIYHKTENEDEFEIIFSGSTIKIAIRQINFGNAYSEDWRRLYVVYDEAFAGTYTAADGATLILDGYGFNATFRDSDNFVIEGEFAKEWEIVTLLYYDAYTDSNVVYTFKIDGDNFVVKNNEAGVYFQYLLDFDLATDITKLILGGDGTACYSYDDGDVKLDKETTYVKSYDNKIDADVYTLTFDDTSTIKFVLDTFNNYQVFIEYDANWAGEFTNSDGYTLILTGYGRAIYRDDFSEIPLCTVFGKNYNAVTFVYDNNKKTFVLNRENHSFSTASENIGIYYPYQAGTISAYKRMIIDADGTVTIQAYDEDSVTYQTIGEGTYSKDDKNYTFNPTSGEGFRFKLSTAGGYGVYREYDGYSTHPLTGDMVLESGEHRDTRLTLDGYGSATYNFFYEDDGLPRTRKGYYYFSEEDDCLIFVATNENDEEYWKYYIDVNDTDYTFEIIAEGSPLY
ncbi:MAG: hypothetical protein NC179_00385, partial [[Eubacterium] siraeum]|nr:hypothetical protein [[Eubacterium] siraeum]